ncbi:MAG: porin family protein [Cyclobacteriaceae bacterium]
MPTLTVGQAFWFGAKVGAGFLLNDYQSKTYKDTYNFTSDPSFNAGIIFGYSGSPKYGVHTELYFQQTHRKLTEDPDADILPLVSEATYDHLVIPVLMQYKLSIDPRWKVFISGGPRIGYWLGGKLDITSDELVEFGSSNMLSYSIKPKPSPTEGDTPNRTLFIEKPNRFQYGLILSLGTMFDVQEYQRIIVDARLTWMHSNYGFNDGNGPILAEYSENYEFRQHSLMFNLGYVFGYDPVFARKGKSTQKRKTKKR